MTRSIPGAVEVQGREFIYVELLEGENFHQLLNEVLAVCPEVPLPKTGGALEEKTRIVLPNGKSLLAISYKGDLPGWRQKLISYCVEKRRLWGVLSNQRLSVSDGEELPIIECEVIFDR